MSVFASQVESSRIYLPQVTNATQVDSEAYVPLIGELTRGADIEEATQKATETIDELTGCTS